MFIKKTMDEIMTMTKEEFEAYEIADRINDVEEVTKLIDSGVKTFRNDHNGNTENLDAVVYLSSNYVCPVFINNLCCLNRLYVGKDGNIHLSTRSVAGNFGQFRCNKYPTPVEFVDAYVTKYNDNAKDLKDRLDITIDTITNYKVLRLSLADKLAAIYD